MDRVMPTQVFYELWDLETGNLLECFASEGEALNVVREYVALEGPLYLDVLALRPIREERGQRSWLPKIDGERLELKLSTRSVKSPGMATHVASGE
jgi:hypothetical protein